MKKRQDSIKNFFKEKSYFAYDRLDFYLYTYITKRLKAQVIIYEQVKRRGITIFYIRVNGFLCSYILCEKFDKRELRKLIKRDFLESKLMARIQNYGKAKKEATS